MLTQILKVSLVEQSLDHQDRVVDRFGNGSRGGKDDVLPCESFWDSEEVFSVLAAYPQVAGLESHDPAECGRYTDGAADIGGQSERRGVRADQPGFASAWAFQSNKIANLRSSLCRPTGWGPCRRWCCWFRRSSRWEGRSTSRKGSRPLVSASRRSSRRLCCFFLSFQLLRKLLRGFFEWSYLLHWLGFLLVRVCFLSLFCYFLNSSRLFARSSS